MKTLILPIDVKSREFDARLLHAAFALAAGWRVITGSKTLINRAIWRLPRGVYLFSTVGRSRLNMARWLRRAGFASQGWDEEGLVYGDSKLYRRQRLLAQTMALIDQLFAWGEASAADMRKEAQKAGKRVEVAGNPRLDLLHPKLQALYQPQADALRKKHGPFILITTNLSWANPHVIPPEQRDLHGDAPPPGREGEFSYLQYQKEMLAAFMKAVPAIAGHFPDHKVIIRPHPVERVETWQRLARELANVEVIREGPVLDWTRAADVLVHSNSTTGLEARLMGKCPIAYVPFDSPRHESPLPNGVSLKAHDEDELLDAIAAVLAGRGAFPAEGEALLRHHVHITDDLRTPHFVVRAEELVDGLARPAPLNVPMRGYLLLRDMRKRLRRHHARDVHRRNIFPDTTLEETIGRLMRIAEMVALPQREGWRGREIAPNIFEFVPA